MSGYQVSDPLTIAGIKATSVLAMGAGAGVSSMLMNGPWQLRVIAGLSGAACTFVGTPVVSPIAVKIWEHIYLWMGVPIYDLPKDSVIGFVGFTLGLTGIDVCRWLIERTKFGLRFLRFPWREPDQSK